MNKHLKYLSYVLRHKWFVAIECFKYGLIWRGISHDMSKFLPSEWTPYVWSFNGPWKYNERPDWLVADFDRAWLQHQHRNKHHWQHWVLEFDEDDPLACVEMPKEYAIEMVCDWVGAGKAQGNGNDVQQWYAKNREKIQLHPKTRTWVESMRVLVQTPEGD